jgi:hypothetical protein
MRGCGSHTVHMITTAGLPLLKWITLCCLCNTLVLPVTAAAAVTTTEYLLLQCVYTPRTALHCTAHCVCCCYHTSLCDAHAALNAVLASITHAVAAALALCSSIANTQTHLRI